ncbi:MAG: hypothetical protein WAX07_07060 [Candidatus Altiarchaeia archaeon]
MHEFTRRIMRSVEGHESFKLKRDHHSIVAEIFDLAGLRDAIREAPDEAILFHLSGRNDYAAWVGNVLGSKTMQEAISQIGPCKGPGKARQELLDTLDLGIKVLKDIEKRETALIY